MMEMEMFSRGLLTCKEEVFISIKSLLILRNEFCRFEQLKVECKYNFPKFVRKSVGFNLLCK